MTLDYVDLAKRAFRNAWHYKFLWPFGFFVAAADYMGFSNSYTPDDTDGTRIFGGSLPFGDITELGIALIVVLIMLALLFGLIMLVLGVISEGALVLGIKRKELGQEVTISDCWSEGISKFFRVLGILLISIVVGITTIVIFAALVVPAIIGSAVVGIIMAIFALPVVMLVLFVLEAVLAWAIRLAVYDDFPFVDSLKGGLDMLREYISETVLLGLTSLVCQIGMFIVFAFVGLVIAIPFIIMGFVIPYVAIALGVIVGLVLFVLFSAFTGVFKSSIWTIAYMHLKDKYGTESADSAPIPES